MVCSTFWAIEASAIESERKEMENLRDESRLWWILYGICNAELFNSIILSAREWLLLVVENIESHFWFELVRNYVRWLCEIQWAMLANLFFALWQFRFSIKKTNWNCFEIQIDRAPNRLSLMHSSNSDRLPPGPSSWSPYCSSINKMRKERIRIMISCMHNSLLWLTEMCVESLPSIFSVISNSHMIYLFGCVGTSLKRHRFAWHSFTSHAHHIYTHCTAVFQLLSSSSLCSDERIIKYHICAVCCLFWLSDVCRSILSKNIFSHIARCAAVRRSVWAVY